MHVGELCPPLSYKTRDAKWPLSQGKSLEKLMAQTHACHSFSRTWDTGEVTPLGKSPFSGHPDGLWRPVHAALQL